MNCSESGSSKKDLGTLGLNSRLHQFKHDFLHAAGRTPHSEVGSYSEVDAISKQGSPYSYEKSQEDSEKQIGVNESIAGQQYQGEETGTKGEQGAEEKKQLPHKENMYILKHSYDVSNIVPVKRKEVQSIMDCHGVVNRDINKDDRKCFENKAAVCIDDIHPLIDKENKSRNSDHEEAILVSDDSDDDISVYDIDDCKDVDDSDDDIKIVHCVSKSNMSNVSTRNLSVQKRALDYTKNSARKNDFEHPCELHTVLNFSKPSVSSNVSASPNKMGNLVHEQRGGAQLSCSRISRKFIDSFMNASQYQASTSVSSLHPEMWHPSPTFAPQVLPGGAYDLSRSTVIQSTATPSSYSPSHNISEFSKSNLFSPIHKFEFPIERPQYVSSPEYPSSSDVSSLASSDDTGSSYSPPAKKHGCYRSLVPFADDYDAGTWNPAIPSSSSDNFAASSHESILSVFNNSPDMSAEPPNQEVSVPLKGNPELMQIHSTSLETSGTSHNVQEGKEMFKKKEISAEGGSDSDGDKKQQNVVEDKTETTQKDSRPEWECAICLETISSKRGISATMCGHVYCTPCITEVLCKKKECPTCRKALDDAQVHPLFFSG